MTIKILTLLTMTIAVSPAAGRIPPRQPPAKTTPDANAASIPDGVREIQPNTYTFTDTQGQKWIYRKTPFGVSRLPDKPVTDTGAVPADEQLAQATTAVDRGESILFTRPGPFGVYRWESRKTDLNAFEQLVWSRKLAMRKSAGQE